ncbi:MYO19 [Cervus elaphus hippelaphus]|uniref:MYO19 n=1 Tax=Cervus elaphus hippelaphus TaxID=46360 RepID=A0A212DA40_CEREH|nr:MYO19 [Cervus elaphus hippelaphus]
MLQQINGHGSGSDAHGGETLREDLQEFLGGEAPLQQLDDLTKVNPVTLETVLRCLQARYTADTFYTNAGCTLVALNPFKPVPQLYSPELMREYHAASQPQTLRPHIFTVGEQTYRNVRSLIEPVNQSIVVSGESGAGKIQVQLLLLLAGRSSSEARVLEGPGDPGRAPKMLYPDRGIPPNTTGAADQCKNSEELYYKLEQGLSSHNGEEAYSVL